MAVIPKELDELVQEYLTDGIITAKERQVLLKKAVSLGLDQDEVDLYIDAQQQKVEMAVNAAVAKKRGNECPHCGGSIPDLIDKCPHCGQHITVQANEEIKEIIENLEEALVDLKAGKDIPRSKANVEKYCRRAELYYSNNPKVKTLITKINEELAVVDKNIKAAQRANFMKQYWPYIVFGVVLLIEFIMWRIYDSKVSQLLLHTEDNMDEYLSASMGSGTMVTLMLLTVTLGLYLLKKYKKR